MAFKFLSCICGNGYWNEWAIVPDNRIVECSKCGVRRLEKIDEAAITKLYASGDYHADGSPDVHPQEVGRDPIKDRFDIDYNVARLRIKKLWEYKPTYSKEVLIDIGCGNGAFMVAASEWGYDTWGLDLSTDAVPDSLKLRTKTGELRYAGFQRRSADVITFNDSFEHFIDPISALKAARGILKRDGILVVELPDMGCAEAIEQGANFKHVKPHEHIWYFTATQLRNTLEAHGFTVVGMDVPIPGKVTAYASPTVVVEDVEVLGPPGIGDILWTLQKLKAIKQTESPCRLKYVICADRSVKSVDRARDFIGMCKYIDSQEYRPIPLPRDVGCPDPSFPIYELFPNDYLDPKSGPFIGGLIENWRPELSDADWDIGIEIPQAALFQAKTRLQKFPKHVAIYLSSRVWNRIVADPIWTARHWAVLLVELSDAGYTPVILGAGQDGEYADDVAAEMVNMQRTPSKVWLNLIGRTSVPLAMAIMKLAHTTIGIANGLPMLPLFFGAPAIIFWPVRGISKTEVQFCPEFNFNWLPPHIRNSGVYTDLTIGTFTVDDVMRAVLKNANQNDHLGATEQR